MLGSPNRFAVDRLYLFIAKQERLPILLTNETGSSLLEFSFL